jgi:hypothetical protein
LLFIGALNPGPYCQLLPEGFFDINKKIFDSLLDRAIDLIIAWLNRTIWKVK